MSEPDTKNPWWDVAIKVAVPLSFILGGAVIGHEIRLSNIESSRFTLQDGYVLRSDVLEYMKTNFPPDWMKDDLRAIKTKVELNSSKLNVIQTKIETFDPKKQ